MKDSSQILISTLASQGWYSPDLAQLRQFLMSKLSTEVAPTPNRTHALICPHAGYTYCGDVFGQAMQTVQNTDYSNIIIIGPTHYVALSNAAVLPTYAGIKTPLGTVTIDQSSISDLVKNPYFEINDTVHDPEHSIQMHLPFLQVLFPDVPIIPIVIGSLSPHVCHSIATSLNSVIHEKTLLMISSDFTHYGPRFDYQPFIDSDTGTLPDNIKHLDMGAIKPILDNDLGGYSDYIASTQTTICGRYAIQILLELCKDISPSVQLCDYQRSGDLTGDYSNCVSYASLSFQGGWS